MPHQALELAAGATARLTGLDSATTLPDLCEDLLGLLRSEMSGKLIMKKKMHQQNERLNLL